MQQNNFIYLSRERTPTAQKPKPGPPHRPALISAPFVPPSCVAVYSCYQLKVQLSLRPHVLEAESLPTASSSLVLAHLAFTGSASKSIYIISLVTELVRRTSKYPTRTMLFARFQSTFSLHSQFLVELYLFLFFISRLWDIYLP